MMDEKKILVSREIKAELILEFSCSEFTVRKALNGHVTTYLHAQIRQKAIEKGGYLKN